MPVSSRPKPSLKRQIQRVKLAAYYSLSRPKRFTRKIRPLASEIIRERAKALYPMEVSAELGKEMMEIGALVQKAVENAGPPNASGTLRVPLDLELFERMQRTQNEVSKKIVERNLKTREKIQEISKRVEIVMIREAVNQALRAIHFTDPTKRRRIVELAYQFHEYSESINDDPSTRDWKRRIGSINLAKQRKEIVKKMKKVIGIRAHVFIALLNRNLRKFKRKLARGVMIPLDLK